MMMDYRNSSKYYNNTQQQKKKKEEEEEEEEKKKEKKKKGIIAFIVVVQTLANPRRRLHLHHRLSCPPVQSPGLFDRMSRHRNIRGRTFSYDDDYQDDDPWDSGSDYAMSPNSQRYMYNRSEESTLADNFFGLGESHVQHQQSKHSPLRFERSINDAMESQMSMEKSGNDVATSQDNSTLPFQIDEPPTLSRVGSSEAVTAMSTMQTAPANAPHTKKSTTPKLPPPGFEKPKKGFSTPPPGFFDTATPKKSPPALSKSSAKESSKEIGQGTKKGQAAKGTPKSVNGTKALNSSTKSHKKQSTDSTNDNAPSKTPILNAKKIKLRQEQIAKATKSGKPIISMVVIGHVDAGKSTLMGHLLHSLGEVDKRTMHKYEKLSKEKGKASFKYAWVLDNDDSERERGVTMDVGYNHFETENRRVTLLDAPGHKDFIPNMISGATQADVAVLVVTAPEGEFMDGFSDGGQTKEHASLVRSLGVKEMIVAINKMDMAEWSEERFNAIKAELDLYLLKKLNFKTVRYIPVSGMTGENLTSQNKECNLYKWYKDGPTLLQGIDQFPAGTRLRAMDKPFRFSVSDVFKSLILGGAVVSGRVQTGVCVVGDELLIMPINQKCTIKNIFMNNISTEAALVGQTVEISLSGLDDDPLNVLRVGQVLCEAYRPVPLAREVEARIQTFDALKIPMIKGTQLNCHHQNVELSAIVSKLISLETSSAAGSGATKKHKQKETSLIEKSNAKGKKRRPRRISKNESGVIRLKFAQHICIEKYEDNKQLGRFVLRSNGDTVASGMILKISKSN